MSINFSEMSMQAKALDLLVTNLLGLPTPFIPVTFTYGDVRCMTGCERWEAEGCLERLQKAGVVERLGVHGNVASYMRGPNFPRAHMPVNRVTHLMVNSPGTPEWNLMYSDDFELIGLRFARKGQENTHEIGKYVVEELAAKAPLGVELEFEGVRFFGVSVLQATVKPWRQP